jgi:hypothetical protein
VPFCAFIFTVQPFSPQVSNCPRWIVSSQCVRRPFWNNWTLDCSNITTGLSQVLRVRLCSRPSCTPLIYFRVLASGIAIQLMEEYHLSQEVGVLAISLFVVCLDPLLSINCDSSWKSTGRVLCRCVNFDRVLVCFSQLMILGPLLWGPLSEQYGRRPIFIYPFLVYTVGYSSPTASKLLILLALPNWSSPCQKRKIDPGLSLSWRRICSRSSDKLGRCNIRYMGRHHKRFVVLVLSLFKL